MADDDVHDGVKTFVNLAINKYVEGGAISKEWRKVSVPLVDFPENGWYWDSERKIEVAEIFDWNNIFEFRIMTHPGDNKSFNVWIDDIYIRQNIHD